MTSGSRVDALVSEDQRAWYRVGRNFSFLAGIGFLIVTVLYLLDAINILGASPAFHSTGAGPLRDEANFWAAVFAHQHGIVWDVILRDTLGPLTFVAVIVVSLAIRRLVGGDRPGPQLMVVFVLVGSLISTFASLLYLGNVEFWRFTGWSGGSNPVSMVAVGRDAAAINNLTTWAEAVGYVLLAVGLVYLGNVAREDRRLPSRLGSLAFVEATLLVGLAVAELAALDVARSVLSLLVGAVIAPWLFIWLGRHFDRSVRTA